MTTTTPRDGKPGTTDQSPRWEGPEETRPAGYLPAVDNPAEDRDAAGENLNDPDRRTLGDAFDRKSALANPPATDPQYAGHPEFSQDAAANKPPRGIGNSEPVNDPVDPRTNSPHRK